MDTQRFNRRIYVPVVIIILVVGVFIAKLFYLQIIHGKKYEQLADRQYITTTTRMFDRGNVYFTEKMGNRVSAATLKSGFKLVVNGKQVTDPEGLYEKLGPLLAIPKEKFIAQIGKKSSYIELASNIGTDIASQVSALKIPEVTLSRNNWRFYPADRLASHVIGFLGYKGDEYLGRYGLERTYEEVLARKDDRLYVNFFAEVFSDITKFMSDDVEKEGDIITTIEPNVQHTLETALGAARERWDSDRVGGIVMDPKTGAIYAMALDNGFDLNQTRTITDIAQFNNPLVEGVFEMGSIMKPIIMAIALDQGAVTPQTTYFDQGSVKVGDRTIYNFDKRGRGLTTMQTVLNQSLNTGMVFTMQKMSKSAFKNQWLQFGFDKKTGIDLPAEGNNLISNINTNRDVEFANVSFGQGVALTPIAMTRALAVLANGGNVVTPHLVSEIEFPSGLKKQLEWPVVASGVIKPETKETITQMLVAVFDSYGGGKLKFEHYSVAAKTGTAQIANPQGGYFADRNLHTFMAYFPANDPKFIVFMYNMHPKKGAQYSSETLLPPFVDLARFLISYYDVPPDR